MRGTFFIMKLFQKLKPTKWRDDRRSTDLLIGQWLPCPRRCSGVRNDSPKRGMLTVPTPGRQSAGNWRFLQSRLQPHKGHVAANHRRKSSTSRLPFHRRWASRPAADRFIHSLLNWLGPRVHGPRKQLASLPHPRQGTALKTTPSPDQRRVSTPGQVGLRGVEIQVRSEILQRWQLFTSKRPLSATCASGPVREL